MSDFLQFLASHWLLATAFIVVLAITAIVELREKGQQSGQTITSQATINLINRSDALLFDLREEDAYLRGHIIGAIHINESELSDAKSHLQGAANKTIILISQQGAINRNIIKQLKEIANTDDNPIQILAGGMSAWNKEHLPVSTKGTVSKKNKNSKNSNKKNPPTTADKND